jgi:hypothetical protein
MSPSIGQATARGGRTATRAKEYAFDLLCRFLGAIESGLRACDHARACLEGAMEAHGIALPSPLPDLAISQPGPLAGLRVTRDVVFGTGGDASPGPFPAQAARLVWYGVKPAAIVPGPERDLVRVLEAAYRRGLVGLLSPVETVPLAESDKGGFSNLPKEVRPARPGSGGWRELVIARDARHGVLAWAAHAYGWDAVLGTALGFPACCVAQFAATWDRVVAHHRGDPAELLLEQEQPRPADWRLNVLGRYLGFRLLQHFPCGWRCEPSRRLAGRYVHALARHEPQSLKKLTGLLRCPYVFTRRHGVLALVGAHVRVSWAGWEITYAPARVLCTDPESDVLRAVRGAQTLTVTPTAVRVRGRSYGARTALFV